MKDYIKVTYRDIAKMFCKAMPVEGEDYGEKVVEYLKVIKAMSIQQKTALKIAYVFSRKIPVSEREDLFQDLTLTLLRSQVGEEKLAYAIARCDWIDWWRAYKTRSHYSLDSVTEDNEGNTTTVGELLVGECEFEQKLNGKLDAQKIYDNLPGAIRHTVTKRLKGLPLAKGEWQCLDRWSTKNLHLIAELT